MVRPPQHSKPSDDDEVGPAGFARLLGHADVSWISRAIKVPPPGFPTPDRWVDLPSGRQRPMWKTRRCLAYKDSRTTVKRKPSRAGRPNGPAYRYAGDSRLTLARRLLNERPDATDAQLIPLLQVETDNPSSCSSWNKILTTARTHPESDA